MSRLDQKYRYLRIKPGGLPRPERTYLLDESRDLIYIPIPKVACTSLKSWFVQSSPGLKVKPDLEPQEVHDWLNSDGRQLCLQDLASIEKAGMFRFAFVRNPWSRLVSGYLNRIVERKPEARNAMKRFHRGPWYRWDKRARYYARKWVRGVGWDPSREFTFREFVAREVAGTHLWLMDGHWRPQHTFLRSYEVHFIGRFERLAEDMAVLAERLGIQTELPRFNRTRYLEQEDSVLYADCPPLRLRSLPAMPRWRQFYTPDLVDEVARIYEVDIERFGYDF